MQTLRERTSVSRRIFAMNIRRRWCDLSVCVGALFVGLLWGGSVRAADAAHGPATVAEAAKVIDLANLPLIKGAEEAKHRSLASVSYNVENVSSKSAFEFYRKRLTDMKWKELPNGYSSEQGASGTFARDGYSLSLSVFPTGKPDSISVMLKNHGNVDLAKLPLPPGTKPFFGGPTSAAFITEKPVEETSQAVEKLLAAKGWQRYGTAGTSLFFKQNAVRLLASIASAPAQGGKTVLTYSSELMSVELPAPADTIGLQYSDSAKQLFFDSKQPKEEIFDFYRQALKKAGWEVTTEAPIQLDFKDALIFRNAPKAMLTLTLHELSDEKGVNRVLLRHQTAAELAEIERLIKEEKEKQKLEEEKRKSQ